MAVEVLVFQGRVGDRNDLGIPGARAMASAIGSTLGLKATSVGTPEHALNVGWALELQRAKPALQQLQAGFERIYSQGGQTVCATGRCAASIATLPVIALHHPEACVVWFDAHADLNTPASTVSGYLGGLALAGPLGLWDTGFGCGLAFENVILVGQRDIDPFEADLIRSRGIRYLPPSANISDELRTATDGRPVYVHLDCDVLNPGIVPTEYIHEGGLSLSDLRSASDALARHDVLGLEIAEFQIAWKSGGIPVSPLPLIGALMPLLEKLQA